MATASAIAISTALTFQADVYNLALTGRKLSFAPENFSRILYIPSHNDKATHLPVYEFGDDYRAAVKNEPIGTPRYKTSVGLMKKPTGDGRIGDVQYLVDFDLPLIGVGEGRRGTRKGTVRRRVLGTGVEVGLSLPAGLDEPVEIIPSSTMAPVPVKISYPIPVTTTRFGSSRNPWFTFTIPSLLDGDRMLQWQVHPVEHGLLRYTLVELSPYVPEGQIQSAVEDESIIRAIYHNVGLGFSLSQRFSEGALLMSENMDTELEALIVASLLGLLWQARRMGDRARRPSKFDPNPPVVDEDVESSPKKKTLFRKILRKK